MHQIRRRLTYANVMSTIAVFLVLGGVAVAATQLPKNSVGTKQLKKNAVTTVKIKKNAVTAAKLKAGAVGGTKLGDGAVTDTKLADGAVKTGKLGDSAVTESKLADGAVSGAKINAASTPFSRIVHEATNNATQAIGTSPTVYPLNNATYTQGASEVNSFAAALDVTFEASCTQPRSVAVYLLVDPANPTTPTVNDLAAVGVVQDSGTGAVTKRVELGTGGGAFRTILFQPGVDEEHALDLIAVSTCAAATSGVTATFGGVDVIGTK
jgi:hypothetical protein